MFSQRSIPAAAIAALLLATPLAAAERIPRIFAGGGAAGTTPAGFEGGWSFTTGLTVPVSANADFVVRGDWNIVPEGFAHAIAWAAQADGPLGVWPPGAQRTTYFDVLAGVRLRPDEGAVRVYLDGLLGVGHLSDPSRPFLTFAGREVRDDTSLATSLGGGFQFILGAGSVFIDAHVDHYFLRNAESPVIPIRLGMSVPLRRAHATRDV